MRTVLHGLKEYSYVIVFVLVLFFVLYTMTSVVAMNDFDGDQSSIMIKQGDTLWGIAQKHHKDVGLSIQDYIALLQKLNQLDTVMIYPGQELMIIVARGDG